MEVMCITDSVKKRLMQVYIFRQNLMHTIRFLQWCLEEDRYLKTIKEEFREHLTP